MTLLLSRLLLLERLKLIALFVLGTLYEVAPDGLLVVEGPLVLDEEVIEQLNLDEVLLSDQVWILLGGVGVLFSCLTIAVNAVSLLGPLLQVLFFDGDEELAKEIILLAVVVFADDQVSQRCEGKEVDVHDALVLHQSDELCVGVSDLKVRRLCSSDQ